MPDSAHAQGRAGIEPTLAPTPTPTKIRTMKIDRPEPNAELSHTFEPLRFVFAIGALLLGFAASVRF